MHAAMAKYCKGILWFSQSYHWQFKTAFIQHLLFFSYNIFLNSLVMILDQKRFCLLKETSEKNCFLSSLERTLWSIVNNKCRNEVPGSLSLGSYFTTKEAIPSLIQLKGYSNSDKSFKMRLIFHYSGILPRCSHNSFFMAKSEQWSRWWELYKQKGL